MRKHLLTLGCLGILAASAAVPISAHAQYINWANGSLGARLLIEDSYLPGSVSEANVLDETGGTISAMADARYWGARLPGSVLIEKFAVQQYVDAGRLRPKDVVVHYFGGSFAMTLSNDQSRVEYTLPQAVHSPYLMIETVNYHTGGSDVNWYIDNFEVLSTNTTADTVSWYNRVLPPISGSGPVYSGAPDYLTNRNFFADGLVWKDDEGGPPGFTAGLDPTKPIDRLALAVGIDANLIGDFGQIADAPATIRVIFDGTTTNSFTLANYTYYTILNLPQSVSASSVQVLFDTFYDNNPTNNHFWIHEFEAFIPEPGTIALVSLAGLVMLRRRR